jgi:CRP-like cAMP-binding protein
MQAGINSAPIQKYKKYAALFKQGDHCQGAFVLLRGKVALSTGFNADRRLHVAYCSKGAILGLAETLEGGAYQTTAVAASNIAVQFVPRYDVLAMIRGDSGDRMRVLSTLISDVGTLQAKVKILAVYRPKDSKHLIC